MKSEGFTLIEVLVAMLVFGISMAATINFIHKDSQDTKSEWRIQLLPIVERNLEIALFQHSKKQFTKEAKYQGLAMDFVLEQSLVENKLVEITEYCISHKVFARTTQVISLSGCYYE